MIERIDVCVGNLVTGTGSILSSITTMLPSIPIRQWSCLGNCHVCYRRPFVLINDAEFLEADSPSELLQKLFKHMESDPA